MNIINFNNLFSNFYQIITLIIINYCFCLFTVKKKCTQFFGEKFPFREPHDITLFPIIVFNGTKQVYELLVPLRVRSGRYT